VRAGESTLSDWRGRWSRDCLGEIFCDRSRPDHMGRRAKDCFPDLMRFGFRHTGQNKQRTGGQMRATRRGHAAHNDNDDVRAAEGDELIGVAAGLDDGTTERAAGSEVKWHSS
jgi:hypothetical protein